MTDLERYLRLATWGLWGEQKRVVRMELEAHVRLKAWKYEMQGLNQDAAITRALNDLGAPSAISAGMSEVYTMPYVFRNSLLAAILMTLGVGNLTAGVAQVVGTTRVPIEACAAKQETFQAGNQPWPCEQPQLWLSLSSLKSTLEAKGVQIGQTKSDLSTSGMISMLFPGASSSINFHPEQSVAYTTEKGEGQAFKIGPDFISLGDLMSALFTAPLPVTVSGWDNAEIRVGETTFILGTAQQPIPGRLLYNYAISRGLLEYLFPSLILNRPEGELEDILFASTFENSLVTNIQSFVGYEHKIRIKNAKPGDVYIVLSREGPTDLVFTGAEKQIIQNARRAFIAPVAADGTIKYISASKTLTVANDTNLARGVIDGAGTISVLRFTGRIDVGNPNNIVKVPAADVTASR
jgi:hypothetical protein